MENKTVTLTIDGIQVTVPAHYTVIDAAREAGVNIPTLCYLKDVNAIGSCRLCLVEIQGARGLQAACVSPVAEGQVVKTNTERIRKYRKTNLELIQTLDEVRQIQDEGRAKRQQAEQELAQIEGELKNKLISMRG